MGLFRIGVAVLAVVGLFSLLGVVGAGIATALGALLILPLFLLKIGLIMAVIGFFGKRVAGCGRRAGSVDWHEQWSRRRRRPQERQPSKEESFEEWHRMAHAREEVDSWAPEL